LKKMFKKYYFTIAIVFIITIGGFWLFYSHETADEIKELGQQNSTIQSPAQKPLEFTFIAGGDVMLSRHVGEKIRKYKDSSWPFRKIYEEFKSADLAFINLESPFYDKGAPITEGMIFKAEPNTIDGLKLAGIDIVSLANNHSRNMGSNGLLYTFNYLKNNSIEYIGADKNSEEAYLGKILDVKGVKFGFLGYTYSEKYSTSNNPAVTAMDLVKLKQGVADLKNKADVIIVSMHAGYEYTTKPNQQQIEFSHAAIDAGADLVIGHHSHWVQQMEKYNGKYIFYGLGNLVFDQMWSAETQKGLVVKFTFSEKNLKQIELKPVKIEDYGQPRWMNEEESKEILKILSVESKTITIQ